MANPFILISLVSSWSCSHLLISIFLGSAIRRSSRVCDLCGHVVLFLYDDGFFVASYVHDDRNPTIKRGWMASCLRNWASYCCIPMLTAAHKCSRRWWPTKYFRLLASRSINLCSCPSKCRRCIVFVELFALKMAQMVLGKSSFVSCICLSACLRPPYSMTQLSLNKRHPATQL